MLSMHSQQSNDPASKLFRISTVSSCYPSLIISKDGKTIIYPCEAIVVVMEITTLRQINLISHTDRITAICADTDCSLLVSCQPTNPITTSYTAVVHVWRWPELFPSPFQPNHEPLATGFVSMPSLHITKCAISYGREVLVATGFDRQMRGIVLVWDLQNIDTASALPIIARSSVDQSVVGLCILPVKQQFSKENFEQNNVLSVATFRFVTISRSVCKVPFDSQSNSEPIQTERKCTAPSTVRIWRLRIQLRTELSQNTCRIPAVLEPNGQQYGHLSSIPVKLGAYTARSASEDPEYTDCCLRPTDKLTAVDSDSEKSGWTYNLILCSRSGQLFEFTTDTIKLIRISQLVIRECGVTSEVELRQLWTETKSSNKIAFLSSSHNGLLGIRLSCVEWICWGPGPKSGLLALASEDGYFWLWQYPSFSNVCLQELEAKYSGSLVALASCRLRDTYILKEGTCDNPGFVGTRIVLATSSGCIDCLSLTVAVDNLDEGPRSSPVLVSSNTVRLMSWQQDSCIVAWDCITDLQGDAIILTATRKGSIRIWKIEQTDNLSVSHVDYQRSVFPSSDIPLFELSIHEEAPNHVILQPACTSSSMEEKRDYHWLRLVCGYPRSGLIHVYSPASGRLLYELSYHKGATITALVYSKCGGLLYSADSYGHLVVWQYPDLPKRSREVVTRQKLEEPALLTTWQQRLVLFNGMVNRNGLTGASDESVKSCVVVPCPDGERLAVWGPLVHGLSILHCRSLDTLVHISFKDFVNPVQQTDWSLLSSVKPLVNGLVESPLIGFHASTLNCKTYEVFVALPKGQILWFDGKTGQLLANRTIKKHPYELDRQSSEDVSSPARWSAMSVSQKGDLLLLSDADEPSVYLVSTRQYHTDRDAARVITATTAGCQRMIGHLHPVIGIICPANMNICLTIDRGPDSGYDSFGSGIFLWMFNTPRGKAADELQAVNGLCSTSAQSELILPSSMEQNDESCNEIQSHQGRGLNIESDTDTKSNLIPENNHFQMNLKEQASRLRLHPVTCDNAVSFRAIGYTSQSGLINNLLWDSHSGLFIYTADSLLICEDLETSDQRVFESTKENTDMAEISDIPSKPVTWAGECLTMIALEPCRRHLAISAIDYWSIEGQKTSNIDFDRQIPAGHCKSRERGEDSEEELLLSLNSMVFTSDSKFLVTVCGLQEECGSIVSCWCTRGWKQLTCTPVNGLVKQVVCSSWNPRQFATIVNVEKSSENACRSDLQLNSLIFWSCTPTYTSTWPAKACLSCTPLETKAVSQTRLSSVTYVSLSVAVNSRISPSGADCPSEVVAVSALSGVVTLWDPETCLCLTSFYADPEICLVAPCGSSCLVTGSLLGTLRLWHLKRPIPVEIDVDCQDGMKVSTVAEQQTGCIEVRLTREARIRGGRTRRIRKPITSFSCDLDGDIGVVGTENDDVWYLNWSEVGASLDRSLGPSEEEEEEVVDSGGHQSTELVCLTAGHQQDIIGLTWWYAGDEQVSSECHNKNILLVTSSTDGGVRIWDPDSYELLGYLEAQGLCRDDEVDSSTLATSITILNQAQVRCRGDPDLTTVAEADSPAAFGCFAVAYADTHVQLFCLHQFSLVSCSPVVTGRTNAIGCPTHLQFLGAFHLVMGTDLGRIVIFSIVKPGCKMRTLDEEDFAVPRLTVWRILSDHNGPIRGLSVCPKRCNSFLYPQGHRPLIESEERWKHVPINTLQSNCSVLQNGDEFDNVDGPWLWLTIGDAFLSIWLLTNRRRENGEATLNSGVYLNTRCRLMCWIPIASLLPSLSTVKPETQAPLPSNVLGAFFLPPGNWAVWAAQFSTKTVKTETPVILIHNTMDNTTQLWLYPVLSDYKARFVKPNLWHSLPVSAKCLTAQPIGDGRSTSSCDQLRIFAFVDSSVSSTCDLITFDVSEILAPGRTVCRLGAQTRLSRTLPLLSCLCRPNTAYKSEDVEAKRTCNVALTCGRKLFILND